MDWGATKYSATGYLATSTDGKRRDGLGDAIYFSVVTATTLGYGDIVPVGWLKASACLEVVGGLLLGGLAISATAALPLRATRLALTECTGTWIERTFFPNNEYSPGYWLTEIGGSGSDLTMFGQTFNRDRHIDGSTYQGTLIANQFPTLIFYYECDSKSYQYTKGIYRIYIRSPQSDAGLEYSAESYDAEHGNRDRVRAHKITDPESLQKLGDVRLRREEMRRLVREYFGEEPTF